MVTAVAAGWLSTALSSRFVLARWPGTEPVDPRARPSTRPRGGRPCGRGPRGDEIELDDVGQVPSGTPSIRGGDEGVTASQAAGRTHRRGTSRRTGWVIPRPTPIQIRSGQSRVSPAGLAVRAQTIGPVRLSQTL
jgi:hypothetical protein